MSGDGPAYDHAYAEAERLLLEHQVETRKRFEAVDQIMRTVGFGNRRGSEHDFVARRVMELLSEVHHLLSMQTQLDNLYALRNKGRRAP